ncbi:hypothetical protein PGT21_002090 [Puccinia graminis f. sp. tritici]|uniref:Uncharacterized protein n=1 Tax=Puccinia graminis f. sp. tritici TaxID=56615 RepID=A0A5B0MKZ1_PUCGR|nr:hypothetical protein PGT21_002090 [Puccinia graminis f. sp. tritici]
MNLFGFDGIGRPDFQPEEPRAADNPAAGLAPPPTPTVWRRHAPPAILRFPPQPSPSIPPISVLIFSSQTRQSALPRDRLPPVRACFPKSH